MQTIPHDSRSLGLRYSDAKDICQIRFYIMSGKICDATIILAVTLPNAGQFSKFFHH